MPLDIILHTLSEPSPLDHPLALHPQLLHKPLILIPPIGPLVQLPERRNISPTSSPVAQNSVDVAPSATESVPGMRPLDASSRVSFLPFFFS